MGAWGLKAFENDQALDFVEQLRNAEDSFDEIWALIEEAKETDYIEFDEAASIVAVAAITSAALGINGSSVGKKYQDVVDTLTFTQAKRIAPSCKRILKSISKQSELQELIEENGAEELAEWRKYISSLVDGLETKRLKAPKRKRKRAKRAKKRKLKAGDVLAIPLDDSIFAFCKIVFLSRYLRNGVVLALYPFFSQSQSCENEFADEYLAHFWTFTSELNECEVVGGSVVTKADTELSRCNIGGNCYCCDEAEAAKPGIEYPIYRGKSYMSVVRTIQKTLKLRDEK